MYGIFIYSWLILWWMEVNLSVPWILYSIFFFVFKLYPGFLAIYTYHWIPSRIFVWIRRRKVPEPLKTRSNDRFRWPVGEIHRVGGDSVLEEIPAPVDIHSYTMGTCLEFMLFGVYCKRNHVIIWYVPKELLQCFCFGWCLVYIYMTISISHQFGRSDTTQKIPDA